MKLKSFIALEISGIMVMTNINSVAAAANYYSKENKQTYNTSQLRVGFNNNEFEDFDALILSKYKDDITPSAWAAPYIKEAKEIGLFNIEYGYNHNITRAEFCRLICFLFESKGYNIDTLIKNRNENITYSPFGDIKYKYVDNAYKLGIVNGVGNNTFNPLGNITRQEAAVMIRKTAEILGYNITIESCSDNTVADWAKESVEYTLANGIMYGKTNGFAPKDNITKQEAIVTLLRLYKNEGKKDEHKQSENSLEQKISIIREQFKETNNANNYTIKNFSGMDLSGKIYIDNKTNTVKKIVVDELYGREDTYKTELYVKDNKVYFIYQIHKKTYDNNTEEFRFYFENDKLIRYIGSDGKIQDCLNTQEYLESERYALEDLIGYYWKNAFGESYKK